MADHGLANGLNSSIHSQVRDLRRQLAHLSKSLADHGIDFDDIAEEAEDFVHGARKNARRAARQVKRDADVITRAMQKAPAATGGVLVVAAAVGFGLGYLYHLATRE